MDIHVVWNNKIVHYVYSFPFDFNSRHLRISSCVVVWTCFKLDDDESNLQSSGGGWQHLIEVHQILDYHI